MAVKERIVSSNEELSQAVESYRTLKAQERHLAEDIDQAKKVIMAFFDTDPKLIDKNVEVGRSLVGISLYQREIFNMKLFREMNPTFDLTPYITLSVCSRITIADAQ